ncbi:hypothetical protein Nepgr_010922 [Nepenthes gracilis]|uniref:NAC domain-containing protein n=1 Tax=Nepenthes gracilis TaxID=150966 RepID=A0AAD3SDG4_NEPGR|nr:hypothetical protein Nepgr_010922 [Nepenthes gracilis]
MEVLPFQSLPLGFRFRPTDVELIDHYLRLKINGNDKDVSAIREVDVCKVEPWDLPDLSMIKTTDREWFFFCPRDRKYPNGQRSNRATCAGYWKATGKDRKIVSGRLGLIGMKKTLVFHMGRAPMGQRTCWIIHEYRSTLRELDGTQPGQGAFVICRLFKKHDDKKQEDDNEGSDCDEGETLVSSRNATNTSHEDLPLEPGLVQESPVSGGHTEEQPPARSDNCGVEVSDQTASYILPAPEEDSNLDEALKYFYDPQGPPSPLHHMHMELVSAKMATPLDSGFGNDYSGIQFQTAGFGRDPISDFLDSVLINPDDYLFEETEGQGAHFSESVLWNINSISQRDLFIKESESFSGSDMEGTQAQVGHPLLMC